MKQERCGVMDKTLRSGEYFQGYFYIIISETSTMECSPHLLQQTASLVGDVAGDEDVGVRQDTPRMTHLQALKQSIPLTSQNRKSVKRAHLQFHFTNKACKLFEQDKFRHMPVPESH